MQAEAGMREDRMSTAFRRLGAELPANTRFAVYDGRFQPFHIGHLAVVRSILSLFDCPVALMIIQSSTGQTSDDHAVRANVHHAPERNPLTLWERQQLINRVVAQENLSDRVTVVGIPRPDLFWAIARSFYPPNRFICVTDKDEYERSKAVFWARLGEECQVVPSAGLPHVSATLVKESIREGRSWQELLHPASIKYFEEIAGPERFARSNI
jgi:nicotinamide-nucleotide adenylyltransferase